MDKPQSPAPDDTGVRRRLLGFFLFPIAVFPLLALATYDWRDMPQLCIPPQTPSANLIGVAGDWFAHAVFSLLGLGAWVIPFLCVFTGALLVCGRSLHPGRRTFGIALFVLSLTCLLQLTGGVPSVAARLHDLNIEPNAGGALGYLAMTCGLSRLLSPFGSGVLMISLMVFALLFTIGFRNILAFLGRLTAWAADRGGDTPSSLEDKDEARRRKEEQVAAARAAKEEARRQKEIEKARIAAEKAEEKAQREAARQAEREAKEAARQAALAEREAQRAARDQADADARARLEAARQAAFAARQAERAAEEPARAPEPPAAAIPAAAVPEPMVKPVAAPVPEEKAEEDKGPYVLPPPELVLNPVPENTAEHGDVEAMEQRLVDTLKVFNVEVTPAFRVTGPVVTQYALTPAPGVKAERIANLSANLQMALEAKSVRIQAPIPGKNAVGIEVPNLKPASVCFREIVDGTLWRTATAWPAGQQPKFHLPLLLGKDAAGNDLVVDLAKMPHLLVAGATGQGKSVCLNAIINGLLMCRTPEQVRFIMVDPKRVEFTSYNRLPHLLVPVINDTKKVVFGLRWALVEMEKRLKLFARVGSRNIVDFNTRKTIVQTDMFGGEEPVTDTDVPRQIPYIVIVIDEVADIMATAGKEVEPVVARLTALARATGIHLILATQRPDAKIITGKIKANIPGRVAFKTSSSIDSRTILDAPGSEDLIGKGDMLFRTAEGALLRAQGAYIADDEIARVIAFIGEHANVKFDAKLAARLDRIKEDNAESALEDEDADPPVPVNDPGDRDPPATGVSSNGVPPPAGMTLSKEEKLYLDALDVIAHTGRASTSHLQRRMGIGYNHAARLIDLLEDRGVIGPARGAGPREVLLDPEAIARMSTGGDAAAGTPPPPDAAPDDPLASLPGFDAEEENLSVPSTPEIQGEPS